MTVSLSLQVASGKVCSSLLLMDQCWDRCKGLSAATFDSEYQARRRMSQRRNKPRHAMWAGLYMVKYFIEILKSGWFRYGVTAGGEAFASSVTSAMEGVFVRMLIVFIIVYSCYSPDEADRGCRVRGCLWFLQRSGERPRWVKVIRQSN